MAAAEEKIAQLISAVQRINKSVEELRSSTRARVQAISARVDSLDVEVRFPPAPFNDLMNCHLWCREARARACAVACPCCVSLCRRPLTSA